MILHRLGLILNRQARRGVAPSKTLLPPRLRKARGTQGVRLIHKNQRGYTLVEVLVAVAITGIIAGGLAMTIFQVITIEARTANHMTAVRQVQNAGYWISHDGQMAQQVEAPDPDGFPLTLTWEDWDGSPEHQVTYTLTDSEIKRSHSIDGEMPEVSLVAQYIDAISCIVDDSGKLTLTVAATVGGDWLEGSETRVYEVTPRPDEIYH